MPDTNIEKLFSQTLLGEYDDDLPWEAVRSLHSIGSEKVFEQASDWCLSSDEMRRARGADVLAQIGWNSEPQVKEAFKQEACARVIALVEIERELTPLVSAIYALGHIHLSAGLPCILSFSQHSDGDVRFAVACALAVGSEQGSFSDDVTVSETLMTLMTDEDDEIRDWATFALGEQGDADSEEIRQALFARLDDENEDVRWEAAIGLGRRRDHRVIGLLQNLLHEEPDNFHVRAAAQITLGLEEGGSTDTPELLGALQRLKRWRSKSAIPPKI